MTRTTRTILVIATLVGGAAAGCNRNPNDAHNDAVEAQKEADQTAVEARQNAEKKIAEANKDVQQAADDAREKAAEAQANANEKIRQANREITGTTNDDVKNWAQKKVDDVNNMIDGAKAKAQAAKPKAKASFNTAIEGVQAQRDALQTQVATLHEGTGEQLDKAKDEFSNRVDKVKDQIRNIEKSL